VRAGYTSAEKEVPAAYISPRAKPVNNATVKRQLKPPVTFCIKKAGTGKAAIATTILNLSEGKQLAITPMISTNTTTDENRSRETAAFSATARLGE